MVTTKINIKIPTSLRQPTSTPTSGGYQYDVAKEMARLAPKPSSGGSGGGGGGTSTASTTTTTTVQPTTTTTTVKKDVYGNVINPASKSMYDLSKPFFVDNKVYYPKLGEPSIKLGTVTVPLSGGSRATVTPQGRYYEEDIRGRKIGEGTLTTVQAANIIMSQQNQTREQLAYLRAQPRFEGKYQYDVARDIHTRQKTTDKTGLSTTAQLPMSVTPPSSDSRQKFLDTLRGKNLPFGIRAPEKPQISINFSKQIKPDNFYKIFPETQLIQMSTSGQTFSQPEVEKATARLAEIQQSEAQLKAVTQRPFFRGVAENLNIVTGGQILSTQKPLPRSEVISFMRTAESYKKVKESDIDKQIIQPQQKIWKSEDTSAISNIIDESQRQYDLQLKNDEYAVDRYTNEQIMLYGGREALTQEAVNIINTRVKKFSDQLDKDRNDLFLTQLNANAQQKVDDYYKIKNLERENWFKSKEKQLSYEPLTAEKYVHMKEGDLSQWQSNVDKLREDVRKQQKIVNIERVKQHVEGINLIGAKSTGGKLADEEQKLIQLTKKLQGKENEARYTTESKEALISGAIIGGLSVIGGPVIKAISVAAKAPTLLGLGAKTVQYGVPAFFGGAVAGQTTTLVKPLLSSSLTTQQRAIAEVELEQYSKNIALIAGTSVVAGITTKGLLKMPDTTKKITKKYVEPYYNKVIYGESSVTKFLKNNKPVRQLDISLIRGLGSKPIDVSSKYSIVEMRKLISKSEKIGGGKYQPLWKGGGYSKVTTEQTRLKPLGESIIQRKEYIKKVINRRQAIEILKQEGYLNPEKYTLSEIKLLLSKRTGILGLKGNYGKGKFSYYEPSMQPEPQWNFFKTFEPGEIRGGRPYTRMGGKVHWFSEIKSLNPKLAKKYGIKYAEEFLIESGESTRRLVEFGKTKGGLPTIKDVYEGIIERVSKEGLGKHKKIDLEQLRFKQGQKKYTKQQLHQELLARERMGTFISEFKKNYQPNVQSAGLPDPWVVKVAKKGKVKEVSIQQKPKKAYLEVITEEQELSSELIGQSVTPMVVLEEVKPISIIKQKPKLQPLYQTPTAKTKWKIIPLLNLQQTPKVKQIPVQSNLFRSKITPILSTEMIPTQIMKSEQTPIMRTETIPKSDLITTQLFTTEITPITYGKIPLRVPEIPLPSPPPLFTWGGRPEMPSFGAGGKKQQAPKQYKGKHKKGYVPSLFGIITSEVTGIYANKKTEEAYKRGELDFMGSGAEVRLPFRSLTPQHKKGRKFARMEKLILHGKVINRRQGGLF